MHSAGRGGVCSLQADGCEPGLAALLGACSPDDDGTLCAWGALHAGTVELWRERATYPRLEVTHTGDTFEVEPVGTNYLLWSVEYDSGEEVTRCERCPTTHMMGWKRRQPPTKIVEYGEPVDGFLETEGVPYRSHVNNKYFNRDAHRASGAESGRRRAAAAATGYPVVRYRDLKADGTRQFKVFLACNSHFHGHHLFHIKVQLVELNQLGSVIRVETAYSPRIKVVSKFLTKKGTKALPEDEVRDMLSMQNLRKRRKLSTFLAVPGDGAYPGAGAAFPSTSARRRKIPLEMAELHAEQERRLGGGGGGGDVDDSDSDADSAPYVSAPTGAPAGAAASASGAAPMETSQHGSSAQRGAPAQRGGLTALSSLSVKNESAYGAGLSPDSQVLFADPMLSDVASLRTPHLPDLFTLAPSPQVQQLTSPLDSSFTSAMLSGAGGLAQRLPLAVDPRTSAPLPQAGAGAAAAAGEAAARPAAAATAPGRGAAVAAPRHSGGLPDAAAIVAGLARLTPNEKYQILHEACTADSVMWSVIRAFVVDNSQPYDDTGNESE